jgi:hypothetical protein
MIAVNNAVIARSAETKQMKAINNAVIVREARPKQAPTIERFGKEEEVASLRSQ